MLPFNKSQILTFLLKLNANFYLALGHHLPLGGQIFIKLRAKKHSADHTTINTINHNVGLTESFSTPSELQNERVDLNCGFFYHL
jgi:hypothetical protein